MSGKTLFGQGNIKQRFNSQLVEALEDLLIAKLNSKVQKKLQHHPKTLALYFEFKKPVAVFVNLLRGFIKDPMSMTVDFRCWVLIILTRVLMLFLGGRAIFLKKSCELYMRYLIVAERWGEG